MEHRPKPLNVGKFYFDQGCGASSSVGHEELFPFDEDDSSSDSEHDTGTEFSRFTKDWVKSAESSDNRGSSYVRRSSFHDLTFSISQKRLDEAELDMLIMSKMKPSARSFSEYIDRRKVLETDSESEDSPKTTLSRSSIKVRNGSENSSLEVYVLSSDSDTEKHISPMRKRNLSEEFSSMHLSPEITETETSEDPSPYLDERALKHIQPVEVSQFQLQGCEAGLNGADKSKTVGHSDLARHADSKDQRKAETSRPSRSMTNPKDQLGSKAMPTSEIIDPLTGALPVHKVVFPKGAWHFSEGVTKVIDIDKFQVSIICMNKSSNFPLASSLFTVLTVLRCERSKVEVQLPNHRFILSNWDTCVIPKGTSAVLWNRSKRSCAKVQLSCSKVA
mmetsp:Transcript_16819/g.30057  ORF Transcript_16819/g.30057 Transcript_16819/m.30057 type:complete len:390 (+) Transcript_16819:1968-3137(+)